MSILFTKNSFLYAVRHCPEFKPFMDLILNPRQFQHIMQVYQIKHLKLYYPVNVDCLVDTLNTMRSRIRTGEQLFMPLKEKDTGLFSFIVGQNRPFVLLLPGGSYGDVCSLIEGFSVAIALNNMGYNAFIGLYRVGKAAHYPNPQDDVATMLRTIYANAEKWNLSAENYAVCGFSAGGHLAASWGTKHLGYALYGLPKPGALLLAYPLILVNQHSHKASIRNMLGKDGAKDPALLERYSIEKHVDSDYPKTYLWQCKDDIALSSENAVIMAEALKEAGCPYRLNIVEGNGHGWGLAKGTTADGWLKEAVRFWQEEHDKLDYM